MVQSKTKLFYILIFHTLKQTELSNSSTYNLFQTSPHRAFILRLIFPTSASCFSICNITEAEQASRERTLRGSRKYLRQWESNSTTPPLPPHGRWVKRCFHGKKKTCGCFYGSVSAIKAADHNGSRRRHTQHPVSNRFLLSNSNAN